MTSPITTAVFPVAGLGTRFLPVTKAGPKEMLAIVDKPVIQYAVEEAVAAGIKQLIFVTSSSKRTIEDYFDSHLELERRLELDGKFELLAMVQNIVPSDVSVVYVRQSHPRGLGHAVLCAKQIVGNAPFAVLLPDDIIDCAPQNCLQGMVDVYAKTGASVLAVETVPADETDQYGIVSLAKKNKKFANEMVGIVEKPSPQTAPSCMAVVGRYILSPRIFTLLEQTIPGKGGEIQLTDGIAKLLLEECVVAYPFQGRRFDCGSKIGFLEATVAFALRRPELKDAFRRKIQELLENETETVIV